MRGIPGSIVKEINLLASGELGVKVENSMAAVVSARDSYDFRVEEGQEGMECGETGGVGDGVAVE